MFYYPWRHYSGKWKKVPGKNVPINKIKLKKIVLSSILFIFFFIETNYSSKYKINIHVVINYYFHTSFSH